MNKKTKQGKQRKQGLCPKCNKELPNKEREFIAVVAIVNKDSISDNEYIEPALPKTAQGRIEALRNAGVDVGNMFAITGSNGGEYIASTCNGKFAILDDNDPIFKQIIQQGTVPNRHLFRRWIMAQMFHMLSCTEYHSKELVGVSQMIRRLGYEYQWKMLINELSAQMKMKKCDSVNFSDRNRWFNVDVVVVMAEDYIKQLNKFVDALEDKKCKGIPYKRVANRNIFVSDLYAKLYRPLHTAVTRIKQAKNIAQLYNATKEFNNMRIKMSYDTSQNRAWIDAYKGSGAFFTIQNLIRFHNCIVIDDAGKRLDKPKSLAFIAKKAEMYKDGEGWRLLAVLKKMLIDNNIDIKKKMSEWANK